MKALIATLFASFILTVGAAETVGDKYPTQKAYDEAYKSYLVRENLAKYFQKKHVDKAIKDISEQEPKLQAMKDKLEKLKSGPIYIQTKAAADELEKAIASNRILINWLSYYRERSLALINKKIDKDQELANKLNEIRCEYEKIVGKAFPDVESEYREDEEKIKKAAAKPRNR